MVGDVTLFRWLLLERNRKHFLGAGRSEAGSVGSPSGAGTIPGRCEQAPFPWRQHNHRPGWACSGLAEEWAGMQESPASDRISRWGGNEQAAREDSCRLQGGEGRGGGFQPSAPAGIWPAAPWVF